MNLSRPPVLLSTLVVFLLAIGWGWIRIFFFSETAFPLTYVLPLLACVWTRQRWQLWSMAAAFCAMALIKVFFVLPDEAMSDFAQWSYLVGTLLNITIGATVIHGILALLDSQSDQNARILGQNAELEAQAEELSQQNEEIKAQAEELAEQNEEIESQSEEMVRQNEELTDSNERLTNREAILQGLLECSSSSATVPNVLEDLCSRAISVIGAPAIAVAILERKGDTMILRAQKTPAELPPFPGSWPISGSFTEVVLRENKAAYVSDLTKRPDIARPFGLSSPIHSVFATPFSMGRDATGIFVACSKSVSHWTEEQFRVIGWIAAQCGLMMETLRWHKELMERTEEVEAANRAKDRFLAMLSHELRTPLTPVLAAASALEADDRLPREARDDIHMIRRNINIQSRLIDDLLDLTRISRGKVDLDQRILGLSSLLQDTAAIVAADLDAKNQTLDVDFSGIENLAVMGDGPRLQQVFWNLLKNAIKFSPANSVIDFHARQIPWESRVAIEVRDRGVGIHCDDTQRIFQPFEQAMAGSQRHGDSGLGLGLAIARAIVELHKGEILVESDGHEKGATFVVELPLCESPARKSDDSDPAKPHPPGAAAPPLRILLVEDHGDTGRIMTRLLQAVGYQVKHAETAAAGFALITENAFDLIISDLGLPDESGLSLMARIRAIRPTLPGICLSGYGTEEDMIACKKAGFTEHLTKPIDISRLEATILKITGRHSATG